MLQNPIKLRMYPNYPPYPWQSELHTYITEYLANKPDYPMFVTLKASRQLYGKTDAALRELLRFTLTLPGSVNAYVSPALGLAHKNYQKIYDNFGPFIKKHDGTRLMLKFSNGSEMWFFSAGQDQNLRGMTVSGILIIDEAREISDLVYTELLKPWVAVKNALTLIISTPEYQSQGFFATNYDLGLTDDPMYKTFDWCEQYPPDESDPRLIDAKKTCTRQVYNTEWLGMWRTMEGATFQFDKCLYDGNDKEIDYIYAGIDFGMGVGKDYTVLTLLNQDLEQITIHRWNDVTFVDQVKKIAEILTPLRNKIRHIAADGTTIGKAYQDMFKQYELPITWISFTNQNKRKMIENLQIAFEKETIKILNDRAQITELQFFEVGKSPTGQTTYNAKRGYTDDIITALYLALEAHTKTQNRYNIIIV